MDKALPAPDLCAVMGENLKKLRESRGITQTALGRAVGVSFQQIQKYERGSNAISAARLFAFSRILGFPYENFYAGLDDATPHPLPPVAIHPAIMARALKIQHIADSAARTKLLKIIDIMTG